MTTISVLTRQGRTEVPFTPGQTILDALRTQAGLAIHAPCGGVGSCRKCAVTVLENGQAHSVLSCQTPAQPGMVLRLEENPNQSQAVTLEGVGATDCPPDPGQSGCGIACDIGTTTVVCHLVELSTGKTLATLGEGNEQQSFGADVISRIKASMEGQRPQLTRCIRSQLSRMVQALSQKTDVPLTQIKRMSVAANPTMSHLLWGLAPDSLGAAPFTPLSYFGEERPASALELPFEGRVYTAPSVSGYVGGDITADLLAVGMDVTDRPTLLIDVGTNGEMALAGAKGILCCSTAAGPAFEGAQIRFGMTAAPGAISQVRYAHGQLTCTVLGDGEARGLCGSGLIDAVAVMLELGALDETGRLLDLEEDEEEIPPQARPYLGYFEDAPAFRLTERVWVTQADVRKLQLGKGAIAAGVQILLRTYGVELEQLDALLLAGGFGSFIRPSSAARIGLFPEQALPVTRAVGNTAAQGAKLALCAQSARDRLDALQERMQYIELSGLAAFNEVYLEQMLFPEDE